MSFGVYGDRINKSNLSLGRKNKGKFDKIKKQYLKSAQGELLSENENLTAEEQSLRKARIRARIVEARRTRIRALVIGTMLGLGLVALLIWLINMIIVAQM
jgi:hypothetical protein